MMNLCNILNVEASHLIQKVKPYQENKIKFPCIVQEKYDGVYCIAFFDNQGIVGIFSATGKEYLSLNHLKAELELCSDIDGDEISFIIFEAYADNVPQPIISGWCRDETEQHTEVYAIVHDVLTMNEYMGIDKTPYNKRIARFGSGGINYKTLFKPIEITANTVEHICGLVNLVWISGGEGVIIKNPTAPYLKGKRNWDLIKLKQSVSYDLLVVGVVEGQGKYKGMLGSLVLRWKNDGKIIVGSGLTNEQRKEWWEDKNKIIGQIVQIDAMKESTEGVLREPIFKGIRHDKCEPDF